MRVRTEWVLPALWVVLVVVGAWRHRPAPVRLAAWVDQHAVGSMRSPLATVGSLVRRMSGGMTDPVHDRRVGLGAVGSAVALLVSPPMGLVVGFAVLASSVLAARRMRRQVEDDVSASVPEAIDLFVLTAGAGHPVHRSLRLVAARAGGPVGRELRLAVRRIDHGERTAEALDGVADELGDPIRSLVSVLCSSERYGTALVPSLERLATEARTQRRRRAEEAARKVPIKLLFPLVVCTLPAFALLTVVPLLVGAFGSLRL